MENAIERELEKKATKKLASKIINDKASATPLSPVSKLNLAKALKGVVNPKPQQLLDILADLQSIDEIAIANENAYDLFDDVDMENYDLLDDVESEEYEEAAAEDDTIRAQFLGMLIYLLAGR